MVLESGTTYTGVIENVMPNDTVSYYIYAADESGRNATTPYIGEPDPFVFYNSYIPVTEILFNPDSVIFLTYEQAIEGVPLYIINNAPHELTINSLTEYGTEFDWYVEEMPVLPTTIAENDSLELNIKVDFIVKGDLVIDSMIVETNLDTYKEILAIDSDLITDVEDNELLDNNIVYPNPFTDKLNFNIGNIENSKISIQIFDIRGSKVIDRAEIINSNSENVISIGTNLLSGTYFYKITSDSYNKSGKIICVE